MPTSTPLDEAFARFVQSNTDVLNSLASTATDVGSLIAAELPDVLQQLLLWNALKSFIFFLLGVFLLLVPWCMYRKWGGRGEPDTMPGYYHSTLTHNTRGVFKLNGPDAIPAVLLAGFFTAFGFLLCFVNLDWLQIIVAPKAYLLEYVRTFLTR